MFEDLEMEKSTKKKVKWEGVVTSIQENVLRKLAHYKYLTIEQLLNFEDIGTTQYTYLWSHMVSLRDRKKPLVGCNSFPNPNPRKGKVHSVYYLNENGKETLLNDFEYFEDDIRYKIGKHLTVSQYQHRKLSVDYQIYLDKYLSRYKLETPFYFAYYDTTGNNRTNQNLRSKTRISLSDSKHFTPDAVYKIEEASGKSELHLFELYNGKDTKYIIKKLEQHAEAMAFGKVHEHFNLSKDTPYKVIVLCTHKSALEGIIKKALGSQKFAHFYEYFICKDLESNSITSEDFFEKWVNLYGEECSFL